MSLRNEMQGIGLGVLQSFGDTARPLCSLPHAQ